MQHPSPKTTSPSNSPDRPSPEDDARYQARRLRYRNIALLFSANIISGFAQGITLVCIPWYIISVLEEPDYVSYLVGGVQFATVFFGLYAGTLVDRLNRKHLFIGNAAAGAVILTLCGLLSWGMPTVPIFFIALAILTTYFIFTIHFPNLYAFVQELFPPEEYGKANSAIELQIQITRAIGMTLGGLLPSGQLPFIEGELFEPWSLQAIFVLNGIAYAASIIFIVPIIYKPIESALANQDSLYERVKYGLRFLGKRPAIFVFGICSHIVFFSALVFYPYLLPTYVDSVLHMPRESGQMYVGSAAAISAVGSLLAGLVSIVWQRAYKRVNKINGILGFLVGTVALFIVLSAVHNVYFLMGLTAFLGFFNSTARIFRVTYILQVVPNHVIGRANSIFSMLNGLARSSFILIVPVIFGFLPLTEQTITALAAVAAINLAAFAVMLVYYPRFNHRAAYG